MNLFEMNMKMGDISNGVSLDEETGLADFKQKDIAYRRSKGYNVDDEGELQADPQDEEDMKDKYSKWKHGDDDYRRSKGYDV